MKSPLPHVLRVVAVLLWIAGVALGAVDAFVRAKSQTSLDSTLSSQMPGLVQAVAVALGLIAIGVLLWGLAAVIVQNELSEQRKTDPIFAQIRSSVESIWLAINQMAADKMPRIDEPATTAPSWQPAAPAGPATVEHQASAESHGTVNDASMQHIIQLLEEIRELALLNDSQRQQRLTDSIEHRKAYLSSEASHYLQEEHWSAAEKTIAMFAAEYPNEPAVAEFRQQLEAGRHLAEEKAIAQLRERVEDLIAIANWKQAHEETLAFAENFPNNAEGQQLLERVNNENAAYVELHANRLYEEIKVDIDRRYSRRALVSATKLLEQFPGHRRSVAIRPQLKTIQENAEIQERQEQERQIQELIRSKQFTRAIEMAEELIERYPESPQADSLERLLPKMEQLAIESEIGTEAT